MLFMSIYSYEPENREAVIKRRAEKEAMIPPGMTIVGEWSALTGGRVFTLAEVEDSRAMAGATAAWADLGKIEIIPVIWEGRYFMSTADFVAKLHGRAIINMQIIAPWGNDFSYEFLSHHKVSPFPTVMATEEPMKLLPSKQ